MMLRAAARRTRWLAGTVVLVVVVAVALPSPAAGQGSTIQALAVGDSITWRWTDASGHGPIFEHKFEMRGLGKAGWRAQSGTTPCLSPWAQWVHDYPKARIDYIVIEDWYVQQGPGLTCDSETEWRAAWQQLVDEAKAKSAFVIVLDGDHPDLTTVRGIDILDYPVPPPDEPDGVHYTATGYRLYAKNVVALLDRLIR